MPSPTFGLSSSTEFDKVSWNVPMIVYGITGYTASSCTVTPSNYQCIPAGKTPRTNPNTTGQNIVLLDPVGTVVDIPAREGQRQADTLNQLCNGNAGQVTCSFNPPSRRTHFRATTPWVKQ
jgi:hypothetical protein